jgi:peptidoglycan/LPS O-acetylase OafA/YrhL
MRLEVVNGLRGLSALSIFYIYTLSQFTPPGTFGFEAFGFSWSLGHILGSMWVGVNFFFFLSGFVLFLPFARGHEVQLSAFYRKRALRLLPLLYVVTTACLLAYGAWNVYDSALRNVILHAALGTFFFSLSVREIPGNPALWSLSVEIWMSVLFPFLVLACRRLGFPALVIAWFAGLCCSSWSFFSRARPAGTLGFSRYSPIRPMNFFWAWLQRTPTPIVLRSMWRSRGTPVRY